jgi:error-prone DNA polymerase
LTTRSSTATLHRRIKGEYERSGRASQAGGIGVGRALSRGSLTAPIKFAGAVIARQRPGTAKGFVFLSLEDETGIANAILTPAVYEEFRQIVVREKFLLILGELQNQEGVVSVKVSAIEPLAISAAEVRSHDFH